MVIGQYEDQQQDQAEEIDLPIDPSSPAITTRDQITPRSRP